MPTWTRSTVREWGLKPHQRKFLDRNVALNSVLYKMCDEHRGHTDRGGIRAKVVIIGRSYASGLERHVEKGLDSVTELLHSNRSWLDKEIDALRRYSDHQPNAERIGRIATVHDRLQRALRTVTRRGNSVRSFVSKYLHFHAPVVPIFDQYANAAMSEWYRWPPRSSLAAVPIAVDIPYWRHLVRCAFVVEEWRDLGMRSPTARAIDDYAITWWES